MSGGTITDNTAHENGGGVRVLGGNFTKTGGTITGHASDPGNGNVVRSAVPARRGHAVFVHELRRKETTAGPELNLSSVSNGGWDN